MKPPRILTINGGSSSLTFALYEAGEPLWRMPDGSIDPILSSWWRPSPRHRHLERPGPRP